MFLFPRMAPALKQGIIDAERTFGFEDHVAVEVHMPDERTIERLVTILQHDAGLEFEGGGHNPHEGAAGSTMLYFVGQQAALTRGARFERFELYFRGNFSRLVERHPIDHKAVDRVYAAWAGAHPPHLPTTARKPTVEGAKRRAAADQDDAEGGWAPD